MGKQKQNESGATRRMTRHQAGSFMFAAVALALALALATVFPTTTLGFSVVPNTVSRTTTTTTASPRSLFTLWNNNNDNDDETSQNKSNNDDDDQRSRRWIVPRRWIQRWNTSRAAGPKNVAPASRGAGGSGVDRHGSMTLVERIKSFHNPKLYLFLSTLAFFRWNGLSQNVLYLFWVGFLIKWYRARYVFKIPVWDRQPNWNNVITSKDQEKDLKAFTCKSCGSTLFIAKSREFFFEGGTGIGGLGCFSCGAKGKDNFVMDRDRIVQDVADMDDYFDYERPLDFVSRSERRKLLKESGGNEEKANQVLIDRAAAESAKEGDGGADNESSENMVNNENMVNDDAEVISAAESDAKENDNSVVPPTPTKSEVVSSSPSPSSKNKGAPSSPPSSSEVGDEGLDALGMDDF